VSADAQPSAPTSAQPSAQPSEQTPVPPHPRASGTGPWPGTDPLEALRTVLGELSGDLGVPFLPELPARGPGADPVGRAAGLLVELPVDLQPMGWRLVDHPGRDASRTHGLWSVDTDALAEAADGYAGPLKLQVVGPWTLAANVFLPRAERAVVDAGATRDLFASLAQGIADHVALVRRQVPGAQVLLQLDEPGLPAVLEGRLPTASGWGRLPAVDPQRARDALRDLLDAVDVPVVIRCASARAPLGLLREVRPAGLSVDVASLTSAGRESLATAVEAGVAPWVGVLDPAADANSPLPPVAAVVEQLTRPWHEVGLDPASLAPAVLTPAGGLSQLSAARARGVLRRLREAADAVTEVASGA